MEELGEFVMRRRLYPAIVWTPRLRGRHGGSSVEPVCRRTARDGGKTRSAGNEGIKTPLLRGHELRPGLWGTSYNTL